MAGGRPRTEKTRHIRLRESLIGNLRKEFPNVTSDGDRVAMVYDYYRNIQQGIDKVGGFLYGKKQWKKAYKK